MPRNQRSFPFTPTNWQTARVRSFERNNPIIARINAAIPDGILLCPECGDIQQKTITDASACVISCMDLRLRDNTPCFLSQLGYKNIYDETSNAGASLGYMGVPDAKKNEEQQYPHWQTTCNDIIRLAEALHHIEKVVLIDHMHCGAFKVFRNTTLPDSEYPGSEAEYNDHVEMLNRARDQILATFGPNSPQYLADGVTPNPDHNMIQDVETYIISVNGGAIVNTQKYTGSMPSNLVLYN
jgi:hypothetical protein